MSTKKLNELLDMLAERHGEGMVRAARAELEAIEKAATYAAVGRIDSSSDEAKHFMDTMLSIHDGRGA